MAPVVASSWSAGFPRGVDWVLETGEDDMVGEHGTSVANT